MKRFLLGSSCAIVLAGFSGGALAADASIPVFDWTGLYVGISAGVASADSTVSDDTPASGFFDNNGGESSITASDTALFGGLNVGYNVQLDHLVLGVEGEVGFNGVDDTAVSLADGNDGDSHHVDYGMYGQLTGRLGFAADRFLPYVKGGLAIVDGDYEGGDIDAGGVFDPNFSYGKSKTSWGYVLGAGLEFAVSDSLSIKAEYNYVDLKGFSVSDAGGRSYEIDDDMHIVKLGANFRF